MSGKEFDKVLSGIIILLIIVVVWKWYQDDMKPSKCRRAISKESCGCVKGKCVCRPSMGPGSSGARGSKYGLLKNVGPDDETSYDDKLQEMALESAVKDSHKKYVKSLHFNGNPTGASHNTDNDGLGMSYADGGNYHGLTRRKWCRARSLATPKEESRVVPSDVITREECHIGMNELV